MVAKGLDLPLVTLVGAVLADVGLNLPDLRANERVFNLLTQVAGRAGRSPLGGQVIIQSFQPDHFVIQTAARHDYASFYRQELAARRNLGYPPFSHLVRLEMRDADLLKAEQESHLMAAQVQDWVAAEDHPQTQIIGPAPCFFSKIAGQYRWQIILYGPDPTNMFKGRVLTGWRIEVDPPSLL
jgi:primosomal protein N' (replication factor Y)